jgi:hypothetical protein
MKNRNKADELWEDLLTDVATSEFRESLLATTVGTATRRRRRRTIATLACLIAPLLLLILMRTGETETPTPELVVGAHQSPALPVATKAPVVDTAKPPLKPDIITDDQLFAMFPDHALALVGPPGRQRLVVLGERAN